MQAEEAKQQRELAAALAAAEVERGVVQREREDMRFMGVVMASPFQNQVAVTNVTRPFLGGRDGQSLTETDAARPLRERYANVTRTLRDLLRPLRNRQMSIAHHQADLDPHAAAAAAQEERKLDVSGQVHHVTVT